MNDPAGAAATRPCRVCAEPIAVGARVCKVCKSYQGWSRYLFQWKDLVTAVMAIIPLWAGGSALWKLAKAEKKEPEVRAAALACDAESYRIALTNVGSAAGLLGPVSLSYRTRAGVVDTGIELVPGDDAGAAVVVLEPGKVAALTLTPRIAGTNTVLQFPTQGGDCVAVARITVKTFGDTDRTTEAVCACP